MSTSYVVRDIILPLVCSVIGGAGAVAVIGVSSEEHRLLNHRLAEFRELNTYDQKMVKASFAEFSIQTEERKRDLRALHEAVQQNPKLKIGLEKYFEWWSALSQEEWDNFPEMSREQQIAFAQARIHKTSESEKTIVVDFADWGQTSMQPLHLTIDECGKIITDSLRDTPVPPEITDEIQQLQLPEHRSLALALWLFDRFRNNMDRAALAVQSEHILKAVLANVSDQAWKHQFQQIVADNADRSFLKFWMFRNLLVIFDQVTVTLGNRLTKQFPVSDAEIVSAFVSLDDKIRQHALMTMPSDEARMRLELLAQSNRTQTPEQKLLVKYIAFARDRQRVIGAITFGLGNRSPRNGNNNPPARPGDRQP